MPDTPIGRELRRRLWRLVLPSYVLVVLVAAGAVWLNDKESDQRAAADKQAELARDQGSCETRNEFREVFETVFTRIDELTGEGVPDLVDLFADLTVPENCDALASS